MLSVITTGSERPGAELTRREVLRAGSLGIGGVSLAGLLGLRAHAAAAGVDLVRDAAVIFLFLGGGPPQTETFDPKVDAPAGVRSATGEVKSSIAGVSFGGTFPRLAALAHRITVVRSFVPASGGNHDTAIYEMLAGFGQSPRLDGAELRARHPSLGAVCSRLRGMSHPESGMPTYSLLTAAERGGEYRNHLKWITEGSGPGPFGPAAAPFNPSEGSALLDSMRLSIPARRLGERRALLAELDRLDRRLDVSGVLEGADRFQRQAFEVIRGSLAEKLDLSREDPRTLEAYDTSKYMVGWNNLGYRPCTLGKQLLMARRLCEAGAGFVTVQNAGWDLHGDGNNAPIVHGMETLGPPLDKALAAFVEDTGARGLSKKILLVVTGEFGRTPRINNGGGRDHWGGLCPLLLIGGGLRMGQVIGASGPHADRPMSNPILPSHLMATILGVHFDLSKVRLRQDLPPELKNRVERAEPIPQLV